MSAIDLATVLPYVAVALGGLAVGLGLGLLRGRNGGRVNELQSQLEGARKDTESARAELAAAKDAIARHKRENEEYRGQVADHFTGTGERLQELTLQYRAIYDHLAVGANALCPERFVGLEGGFEGLAVAEGKPADAAAEDEGQAPASAE